MKRFVVEMSACAALATGLAWAQSHPASASQPPRTRTAAVRHAAPASPLADWLVDPSGDVDGVLLENGASLYFDPSIARMLTLALRIADPIRVDTREGARVLVNERDGSTYELRTFARGGGPRPQQALERMTARGNIAAFLRVPEGAMTGFILSSGEQVRVSPTLGLRLGSLRRGDIVVVEGLGRRGAYGTGMMATHVFDSQGHTLL